MKKITFFIIFLTLIFFSCSEEKKKNYVRKNIHSVEAQKDVEAMNKALEIMRKMPCDNPLSWYYQGAIHWVPDTIKANMLCPSYRNVSDLKDGWDNCTHTPEGQEVVHFLTWHRLYIFHFEKIVRKLSGYDEFALPYWGYTENDLTNKTLHEVFRTSGAGLYESARFDSLNLGYPVSGEISRALILDKLFKTTSYEVFCKNIDKAPHGAMHDYIGAGNDTTGTLKFFNKITGTQTSTGLMGWVPTAGFDPIFWTHHSNIDRLWQQWSNSRNGQPVTLEELQRTPWPYVFFDENGKRVEYTLEEVEKIIYNLNYEFDDTKVQKPRTFVRLINPKKQKDSLVLSHKVESHETSLNLGNRHFTKGDKVHVLVSFLNVPKGVYEVYLNSDETPHPTDQQFLGFMTFFGSDHKTAGETCIRGCCGRLINGRRQLEFTFEVTSNEGNKNFLLNILKLNKNIHSDLVIEQITFE